MLKRLTVAVLVAAGLLALVAGLVALGSCPSPKRRPTVRLARERPIRGQDAEPGWR